MKKLLFSIAVLAAFAAASAYAADTTAYDADAGKIIIHSQLGKTDTAVSVTVTANGDAVGNDNKPVYMYRHNTGASGGIDIEIPVARDLSSGKYYIYYDLSAAHTSESIMLLNPEAQNTKDALAEINAAAGDGDRIYAFLAAGENAAALGLDTDGLSEDGLRFTAKYAALKKEYTVQSFSDMCDEAAVCIKMNADADADGIIKEHAAVFGTTYEKYFALAENLRTELDALLHSADFTKLGAAATYADKLLAANIRILKTSGELAEFIGNNADALGLEMGSGSAYAALMPSAQNKVLLALFNARDKIDGGSAVKTLFDKSVADNKSSSSDSGSGSSSGGSSSSGSSGGGSYIAPARTNPEVKAEGFADISGHWSEEYVARLAEKKVISGYADNTFSPANAVTRAEFVKMLTALFDVKASGGADFADVPADAWYAEAVCAATQNGLVFGADGKFLPQDNISRQDAAVIIYRLCGGAGGNAQFGDYAEIADYAKEAVSSLAAAGIIAGSDGNFYPGNTLTRAEAAVILCKAYDMGVGR